MTTQNQPSTLRSTSASSFGRNARRCFFIAFLLLGASGCVKEEANGGTMTFTYQFWVPLSVFLGGIVATGVGWFGRKSSSRFGWGLFAVGIIGTLVFAPSTLRDRAVVDDDGFSLRTGIWGLTAVHDVKFQDLKMVRITSEEVRGRRGSKRTNYYMMCERKDGTTAKVPINAKVAQAALPYFVEKASQRGIPIVDET